MMKTIQVLTQLISLCLCGLTMAACLEEIVVEGDMGGAALSDKSVFGGASSSDIPDPLGGGSAQGGQMPTDPPNSGTGSIITDPPPPVGGSEQCAPGSLLGPCQLCGQNGAVIIPTRDDQSCMPVDCDAAYRFNQVLIEPGLAECRIQRMTPKESNCDAQGLGCLETPEDACQYEVEEPYMEPVEVNDCKTLEGCSGQAEPEIALSPEGVACEGGAGTCDGQGSCVLTDPTNPGNPTDPTDPPAPTLPSCNDLFDVSFNNNNTLCNEELQADRVRCTYYLSRNNNPYRNGSVFSCDDFCGSVGAVCVEAWNDRDATCDYVNDNYRCNVRDHNTYLCQCDYLGSSQP